MSYPPGQTAPPPEGTQQQTADPLAPPATPVNPITFPTGDDLRQREVVEAKRDAFLKVVPESYRTKEYVQNFVKTDDPTEALLKGYENAQFMVGARNQPVAPLADDATPEQKTEYYKKLGVPEDPQAYVVDATKWDDSEKEVGEFVSNNRPTKIVEGLAAIAQKEGVNDKQFKAIVTGYEKLLVSQNKDALKNQVAKQAQTKTQDEAFSAEINKMYGTRSEVVLQNGRKLIEESVPMSIRDKVQGLSNDAVLVLASALDSVHAKYVREGSFTGTANGGAGPAPLRTAADLSAERREIYGSEAWQRSNHPQHAQMVAKEKANDAEARKLSGLPPKQ